MVVCHLIFTIDVTRGCGGVGLVLSNINYLPKENLVSISSHKPSKTKRNLQSTLSHI